MPEIAGEIYHFDMFILLTKLAYNLSCFVTAAIVYHYDLVALAVFLHHLSQTAVGFVNHRFFIVHGNDDRTNDSFHGFLLDISFGITILQVYYRSLIISSEAERPSLTA